MFRGNSTESIADTPITDTSAVVKTEYLCSCGAKRFKWIATNGVIRVGGFKPEEYEYECLGCGKRHDEQMIRVFFKR